ncbi:small ribosomal subunit Rsm22 family protein [Bdellovibrio bacteriovorus]|uniref:small ribosomal subunit Rsm22 family protein n=1 Tax=Bdellovibrio bacteriovorus TaxID=959 RepID=UPI0021D38D4D|nr:small ribosomal subunit Rsm22 family protein [Bdellovibrio bacteriovorus]UXR64791.1 small ribosomal subunit Rsm22 family protein [Bdellovibrio bacteriovorus]
MQREFSFPASFEESIDRALATYKLSLKDSKALAKCVLALSDYFIAKPDSPTPWNESWAQVAYLCYYLPLNSTRLTGLFAEADKRNFFAGLEHVIDFGAGLATASITLNERHKFSYQLIERASEPQQIIEKHFTQFPRQDWQRTFSAGRMKDGYKTLALFSYSLTELSDLPEWAYQCEALMLVEPSTQQDGRKLLQLRQKLLEKGYHVWAPCTHEGPCPLLTQSKTDWCHDRVHFKAPQWFLNLEAELPMKNRTLTMSYLLMRKTPPAPVTAARVVGDRLKEKGKDRQMICRGSDREFLAWMHKNKLEQEIPRGVLIELPPGLQKVSNELRVTEELTVL